MTERPILFSGPMVRAQLAGRKTQTRRIVKPQPVFAALPGTASYSGFDIACPYGVAGDRLWVRETFCFRGETTEGRDRYRYRADENPATDGWRWKPAIHMPRVACRLVLEVTGIRVERLQSITWQDAFAEGFEPRPVSVDPTVHRDAARDWYMDLWDSLNAKRGHGWATNPWVWVVSFRRAEALKAAA